MALSGSFNTSKYNNTIGLNLSWTGTQSVANNQTTIKWTLKSSGGSSGDWWYAAPITVVINGTTVLSVTSRFKLYGGGAYKKTGTIVITHNEDGTKSVAMSVRAAIYSASVNCTGSKTFTLDKINRYATISDAPDFFDVDNPTIYYNNYAGELVDTLQACISISGSSDDIAYRDISKTGSSYTFNLTQAERNILLSACPNSNTLGVTFRIKTVVSGQTFTSDLAKTMTVKDANPTISSPSYQDTNNTTYGITGNRTKIIQGLSTVRFNFSTLAALKYATLTSIAITVNAITVSSSLTGSTAIDKYIDFGVIDSASNLSASITLTDSRGNKTTISLPITMLSWSLPSAIISCARQKNYYDATDLTVDANYSSLDGQNTILIQYQYKKTTDSSYSALVTIQDNVQTTFSISNVYQWNIRIILTDRLGTTTYNLIVNRGIPLVMFDKLHKSVGINCLPSADETLEVNGEVSVGGDITSNSDISATGAVNGDSVNATQDINAGGEVSGATGSFTGNVSANGVSLPHKYNETEQVVGYWIDGSPIYEKTIVLPSAVTVNANNWNNNVYTNDEDIAILNGEAYYYGSGVFVYWGFMGFQSLSSDQTKVCLYNSRDAGCQVTHIVIRYLKTS